MNIKITLLAAMVLPSLTHANSPSNYSPSSAIEFQQTTNSRIVVEESFLRFYTGGQERITVDADGNIGIGLIAPTANLHISGSEGLLIERDAKTMHFNAHYGGHPHSAITTDTGMGFRVATNKNNSRDNPQFVIDPNGNVGIGVNEPDAFLHVRGEYAGGSGDHTNISNAPLKLESGSGYIRIPHLSGSGTVSTVYNYQSGKNVYWGEPSDAGNYYFRGRDLVIENGKLDVAGVLQTQSYADIGSLRPADSAPEGLFVNPNGSYNTSFQFATKTWGASHAILFDAYKSASQVNGGLSTTGNTKHTHGVGGYGGGAGSIHYNGNGGTMYFFISPQSTGAGTNVVWGAPKMMIQRDGTIGINTSNPDEAYKLHVNGKTFAASFHTSVNNYADFVFEDSYDLPTLLEVEKFIEENNHLPDIPSEVEAKANGVDLQEMQAKLLQKIEELTLYMIDQNKKIEFLSKDNETHKKEISRLKAQIKK